MQGGSQAMEDGVTIAHCLRRAGKANVKEGLQVYERIRYPEFHLYGEKNADDRYERVAKVQKMGESTRDQWHKADWDAVMKDPTLVQLPHPDYVLKFDTHKYLVDNNAKGARESTTVSVSLPSRALMTFTTQRLHVIGGVIFALVIISTVTHLSLQPSPLDLTDPNHFHFTDDNYRLCKERFNCPTLEDWLHSEAEAGHELAVKGLLKAGADINVRVDDGTAALHVAVFKRHYNVVKLLLKSPRVDVNVRTIEPKSGWHDMFSPPPIRWTALHIAAIQGDEKILKLLLQNKADMAATSIEGYTALHRAAEFGKDKIAKLLIAAGAGVEARSMMGTTPLIEAASGGFGISDEESLKVVQILLSAKANVNAEMYDGRSAMWVAVNRRHPKIVDILLKAGASLTSSFDG